VGQGGRVVGGGRICDSYDEVGNGGAGAGEAGRSSGMLCSGFVNANASGNGSDERGLLSWVVENDLLLVVILESVSTAIARSLG
jgi:hypothetical protein